MSNPIKTTLERADEHFDISIREMYFMQIAEVILYDAPTRKAQLKLVVKQPDLEGEVLLEGIAVKQPVMSPNWMVDCEVPTGTHGLLFFADIDFHHWLNTGQITDPPTTYFHQISQCIFIPGLLNDTEQRPGIASGLKISNKADTCSIRMADDGIEIKGNVTFQNFVQMNNVLNVAKEINAKGRVSSDIDFTWQGKVNLSSHIHLLDIAKAVSYPPKVPSDDKDDDT